MECPKCKGKGYTEKEHGLIQVACKFCNSTGNVYGYQLVPETSAAKVPPVRQEVTHPVASAEEIQAAVDGSVTTATEYSITDLAAARSASAIKAAATRKANRAKKAVAA